jgi:hypothetical protein
MPRRGELKRDKPTLLLDDDPVMEAPVHMSDGTVLPITYRSLLGARQHEWYRPIDAVFNAVFYAALRSVGVMDKEVHVAIALLLHHQDALGLSPSQVRGAYGLEKHVFGCDGRFLRDRSTSDWDRELLESRKKRGDGRRHVGPFGDDPDVWGHIERDASIACRHKPDQANIDVEFRWIRSTLGEWPDFRKAPSRGAVKDWLEINRPGNEVLKRDFLKLAWQRRLTPGDRKARSSVFEEDAVEEGSLTQYDEGLEERLSATQQSSDIEDPA